jgi:hypothetical protein
MNLKTSVDTSRISIQTRQENNIFALFSIFSSKMQNIDIEIKVIYTYFETLK